MLVVYLLLWIPPVQQKIKDMALSELMKMTGNKMSVGRLSFRPFNQLKLHEVYVEDLKGDTLFYAEELSAGFDLKQLLQDRLLIQSVRLDHFIAHIERDSVDAPYNFQFFIDAFASDDTTKSKKPGGLVIEIDDVRLVDGAISYDILSQAQLPPDVFDVNHIHLADLNLEVQLKSIDMERLDVTLKSLAFKEKNGLEVRDLQAKLTSDTKQMVLKNLILKLPASEFNIQNIELEHDTEKPGQLFKMGAYALELGDVILWPQDLKSFYPPLANLSDSIRLDGKASGKFPGIDLLHLQATLGTHLLVDASAHIEDFTRWEKSPLGITIRKIYIDGEGVGSLQDLLADAPGKNKMTFPIDSVNLSGEISGSLPDLKMQLKVSSNITGFIVEGSMGYDHPSGKIQCDAELDINHFTYNRYTYRDILAHAVYRNDSVRLDLTSRDPFVPLEITASGKLLPGKESLHLIAKVNHLRLDTTNWLPMYPGAELSAGISADINGFDMEKMKASVVFDSLSLKTNKNSLEDKQLKIDYKASENSRKEVTVHSDLFDAGITGNFKWNTIGESIRETLAGYVPGMLPAGKKSLQKSEELSFNLILRNSEGLTKMLNLPFSILEPAVLKGAYKSHVSDLTIQADLPKILFNEMLWTGTSVNLQTDTIRKKFNFSAATNYNRTQDDNISFKLLAETIEKGFSFTVDVKEKGPQMNVEGSLSANSYFEFEEKSSLPNITVAVQTGTVKINNQQFNLSESNIKLLLKDRQYRVENFAVSHSESEYFKVDGGISNDPADTLRLNISRIQLKTLADAFKLNMNIQGEANGEIIVNQLLSSPLVMTKGFSIKDIILGNQNIGNLNLVSAWSEMEGGLLFKADLQREGFPESVVSGKLAPRKDSLSVNIDIRSIPLDWLSQFTTGTLYGLSGELGANIKASGRFSSPELDGIIYLKDANVGISMLNTQYKLSDTIYVKPDHIDINNFRIIDENKQSALLNGNITHKNFKSFDPELKLNLDNFLVLNNSFQTDSLFYGTLRISGAVGVSSSGNDILVKASLTNSGKSNIMINIPESAAEAQRYSSITFINNEDTVPAIAEPKSATSNSLTLPIKLNVSMNVNPELKLGAVINPQTRDAVSVTGSGNIDFSYDMNHSSMNLLGGYTIKEGQCTLSMRNITKKTFTIREGGTLTFKGDPMATAFDITAVYTTRADLATLDKNFENIMSSSKIMVNTLLTVEGDLNKMDLKYDFEFPGEPEEIKRKVDGLMYTDDIKIKQIAYLLAFNTFYPVNSTESRNTGTDLWTSLASSSLTSQLNNLLSGVLNENWSIGTELHANDNSMSDMEMDVNVSTRLFDDRMTVNSNIGYRNSTSANSTNNFTGDFDIQLKLTKSGDFVLKVYNVTNNQYSEPARTTQGVGVIYKREARTFKGLFRKIKALFK